jgi:DNA topoisomerase IB
MFHIPKGNFYYGVMFGLKNASATYQHAMTVVLDNLIHQSIECYIDDIVVKTIECQNYQDNLRVVFNRI